jgi:hypothetical protein
MTAEEKLIEIQKAFDYAAWYLEENGRDEWVDAHAWHIVSFTVNFIMNENKTFDEAFKKLRN